MARPRKKPVEEVKVNSQAEKEVTQQPAADVKPSVKAEESTEKTEAATAPVAADKEKETPAETQEKDVVKEETKPTRGRRKGSTNSKTTGKVSSSSRRVAKKAEKETVEEVYIQYDGNEVLSNELVDRIKEEYKNEGHRVSSIKTLRVYVHLGERKAYYVINDKAEGKFVEF